MRTPTESRTADAGVNTNAKGTARGISQKQSPSWGLALGVAAALLAAACEKNDPPAKNPDTATGALQPYPPQTQTNPPPSDGPGGCRSFAQQLVAKSSSPGYGAHQCCRRTDLNDGVNRSIRDAEPNWACP
jgi:hypothetical protein